MFALFATFCFCYAFICFGKKPCLALHFAILFIVCFPLESSVFSIPLASDIVIELV